MGEERLKSALYGYILGDIYSIPFHWYYDVELLKKTFPDIETMGIVEPPKTHAAGTVGTFDYQGKIDILFSKQKYYWKGELAKEPTHYHATLKKGQNTHNICIARMFMRQMIAKFSQEKKKKEKNDLSNEFFEVYSPMDYIEGFYSYTTTNSDDHPDDLAQIKASGDLYYDKYIRRYFLNASDGLPHHLCALDQRDEWSQSTIDGINMTLPMFIAYLKEPLPYLEARATELQNLTHKSLSISAGIYVMYPFLKELALKEGEITDEWFNELLRKTIGEFRPQKISLQEMMHSYYVKYRDPIEIPKDEKWAQHLHHASLNLNEIFDPLFEQNVPEDQIVGKKGILMAACYAESVIPVLYYLLRKHSSKGYHEVLKQNVLVGGHTTGRGVMLGFIQGLRFGIGGDKGVPADWIKELAAPDQIEKEIKGLVEISSTRN